MTQRRGAAGRFRMALLILAALTGLSACLPAGPRLPEASPGRDAAAQVPAGPVPASAGSGARPSGTGAPPGSTGQTPAATAGQAPAGDTCTPDLVGRDRPAPETSPVTWTLTSLDVPDLTGPATAAVTFPHRFRFTFSGDVDAARVERTLRERVEACGFRMEATWRDPHTLDLTLRIDPRPAALRLRDLGALQVHLALAGARDASGRPLAAARHVPQLILQAAAPTTLWAQDPTAGQFAPAPLAALPQPYEVLSAGPDGQRFLLRLPILPSLVPGQPVAEQPQGRFFLYDTTRGRMTSLGDPEGPIGYYWLPDGGLLVWQATGSRGGGRVLYSPPGGPLAEILRAPRVVQVAVDPTRRRAAVFTQAIPPGTGLAPPAVDLTVVDLPGGRRFHVPAVARPGTEPDGTPWLAAVLAPGGEVLAYSDGPLPAPAGGTAVGLPGTGAREGVAPAGGDPGAAPFSVWLLEIRTGRRIRLDRPGYRAVGPWSPDGRFVAVGGAGVVDRTGALRLPFAPDQIEAAWSPDGRYLFVPGQGVLETGTWKPVLPLPGATQASWAPTGNHLAVRGGPRSGIVDLSGRWLTDLGGPGILWSPDGRWAYTPNPRGGGLLLNLTGETRLEIPPWPLRPGLRPVGGGPRPLAFTPDGRLILAPRTGP